jgi:purine-binding chemotaxis protein CheW
LRLLIDKVGMTNTSQRLKGNTWVIVEICGQQFAIRADHVHEILSMPEITSIPMCRPQSRGVICLRGRVLPLIDMRKCFGWQSVPEELDAFSALMNQREQDHRNWLVALEKSVAEDTEFRLATDPHKCAFGQWYYSYRSPSPWVMSLLRKFESPHNSIHAIAVQALELAKAQKLEQAYRLIQEKRDGELGEMVSLFRSFKELMRETLKELAMVITMHQKPFAVAIDGALAVEAVSSDLIKELDTNAFAAGRGLVHRVLERAASKSFAMILEPEMFEV